MRNSPIRAQKPFFDTLVAEAQKGPLRPFPTPADMGDEDIEDEV